ncbi:MAG: M28 family peptidase, partial [Salinimicrobium sediminis]|nr:M28 family peptidase [Salinimicrobium sediminis]
MKKFTGILFLCLVLWGNIGIAQDDPVIESIVREAEENSKLESLAHSLLDSIGPRLVGTPQMNNAHNWAVKKFESWGIPAEKQKWGEWRGWERGVTHIDMVSPRLQTLEGRQLAWSPSTGKKPVTAEVITLPEEIQDSLAFQKWLPKAKGKFVLISMKENTGRPDYNWEEFATEASFEKMKKEREEQSNAWRDKFRTMGYNSRTLPVALEKAGAAGIITSNWSRGFGVNKIFGAYTEKIPTLDLSLEDYGLLYRLAENGSKPQIRVTSESKDLGTVPTFNTIATIKGTELPEEYIVLSAHFDSWDGATGATDNGTGTI